MQFKENWAETRELFSAWWSGQSTKRPLMNIWAKREPALANPYPAPPFSELRERYLNVEKIVGNQLEYFCGYEPLAEACPILPLDLGAGSLALYMGSQAYFNADSLWFEPVGLDYSDSDFLVFDPENHWYKIHLDMYLQAQSILRGSDAMLCVPDLVEHLDILASLRGTTALCFDLYDNPVRVKAACETLNAHYKICFDAFRALCTDETGGNAFTAFNIWGKGRTAKIQCDIAAMLSPEIFQEFAIPYLRDQCDWLDNSLFHLDGPECLCHVPALMEIEGLKALQWTSGHMNPHAGEECWDDLYSQVKAAGKGLWVGLYEYGPEGSVAKADRLVRKFGAQGFYFQFPPMEKKDAEALLLKAEREWVC
jgi:5-methyltetrahydrofolate--homocysteine methyltransferase